MKFDFLGDFATVLTFLEHLDGGDACKIQNKLKFGCKNEIWNIWLIWPKFPNSSKCVFTPKNIFFQILQASPPSKCSKNVKTDAQYPRKSNFIFPPKIQIRTFSHPNSLVPTVNRTNSTSCTVDFPKQQETKKVTKQKFSYMSLLLPAKRIF